MANWTRIDLNNSASWPPDGVVVDMMDSGGNVQPMQRRGNLFWFADMSMYVYYVPSFWQYSAAPQSSAESAGGGA